jgi:hypothetical protein
MDPEVEKKLADFEARLTHLEDKNPKNGDDFGALISLAWEAVKFIREVVKH